MKLTIKKTITQEVEIKAFPAYFSYGGQFAKVVNETMCIYTYSSLHREMATLELRTFLSDNDWQPCAPELFYEAAAEAMRRIDEAVGIIPLKLQGEHHAD